MIILLRILFSVLFLPGLNPGIVFATTLLQGVNVKHPVLILKKVYRTNMTYNRAKPYETLINLQVGQTLVLNEAPEAIEKQYFGVKVADAKTYEFDVIEINKSTVVLKQKSGGPTAYYRFIKAVATAPTPVVGNLTLDLDDYIELVDPQSLHRKGGTYSTAFGMTYKNQE